MAEKELQQIIERSQKLYQGNDFESVIELYTEYLTKNESSLNNGQKCRIWNDVGHAKYMQVRFDSAVECYNKALKFDPNSSVTRYNKATVIYRMGHFKEAFNDFQLACQLDGHKNEEFKLALKTCLEALNSKS